MKKIILFLSALAVASALNADDYKSLLVKTQDGSEYKISIDGLKLALTDNNLVVSNSNESVTIPTTDLVSMEFSGLMSSVTSVAGSDTQVSLYSTDGTFVGTYGSAGEAISAVSDGIYVIKTSEGSTRKITVKK